MQISARRRALLALPVLLAPLGLAGCGGGDGSPATTAYAKPTGALCAAIVGTLGTSPVKGAAWFDFSDGDPHDCNSVLGDDTHGAHMDAFVDVAVYVTDPHAATVRCRRLTAKAKRADHGETSHYRAITGWWQTGTEQLFTHAHGPHPTFARTDAVACANGIAVDVETTVLRLDTRAASVRYARAETQRVLVAIPDLLGSA